MWTITQIKKRTIVCNMLTRENLRDSERENGKMKFGNCPYYYWNCLFFVCTSLSNIELCVACGNETSKVIRGIVVKNGIYICMYINCLHLFSNNEDTRGIFYYIVWKFKSETHRNSLKYDDHQYLLYHYSYKYLLKQRLSFNKKCTFRRLRMCRKKRLTL